MDGTQAAREILKEKDIPVVFLSSHTEPEIVEKTEKITSYGYVVKNTGIVVLDASIKMALKLFDEKKERDRVENVTQAERDQLLSIFNSIDEVARIAVECYTARVFQGFKCLDCRGQFHAVIGCLGFASRQLAFPAPAAQNAAPSARARIAGTRAVGERKDIRLLWQSQPPFPSVFDFDYKPSTDFKQVKLPKSKLFAVVTKG